MATTRNRVIWAGFLTLFGVLVMALGVWWFFQVQEHYVPRGAHVKQLTAEEIEDLTFSLRTQPRPREWTTDKINEGLPLRWEKGMVHVLAWEVFEDGRRKGFTQVLVLKKFDKPTEDGGHRWVLAQVYYDPKEILPWHRWMLIVEPVELGEKMPKLTDAQLYGYEFCNDPPTDAQIKVFLQEADWTPFLVDESGNRTMVRGVSVGGVDRKAWKELFGRDVPTELFPELRKPTTTE